MTRASSVAPAGVWSFELEPFLTSIPGQDKLVGWGQQVIYAGIIVSVVYELYSNRERANLLAVGGRGIAAIFIIKNLSGIGSTAQDVCWSMTNVFEEEGLRTIWTTAFKSWIKSTVAGWSSGTLTATFLGWCALGVTVGMFVVKIAILKIAYPFFLLKAVWSGLISVPLSAFPGVNKPKDFFVNIITVALWPVTHALITCLFAALSKSFLNRVAATDLLGYWQAAYKLWENPDKAADILMQNNTAVVVYFVLFCALFIMATAFTPMLTTAMVSMQPISQFASTITTAGMALAAAGASSVMGAAGGGSMLGKMTSGVMKTAGVLDKAGNVADVFGGVAKGVRNLTGADGAGSPEMDARPLVNDR